MKKENVSGNLRFSVYMSERFMNTSLEALELSERSHNCLKRAGFFTIGDVINNIDRQEDLLKYRNLGAKSAKEIMHKIFKYHYEHLPENKLAAYRLKVAKLNGKSTFEECVPKGVL